MAPGQAEHRGEVIDAPQRVGRNPGREGAALRLISMSWPWPPPFEQPTDPLVQLDPLGFRQAPALREQVVDLVESLVIGQYALCTQISDPV